MGQLPKFNTENEDLDQVLQAELSSSNCTYLRKLAKNVCSRYKTC